MDFIRFLGIIRRSLRLIIVVTVLVAGSAFGVSNILPRQYESEARVLVGSVTDPNLDRLNAYQQLAQTYAALATTTPVLAKAAGEINVSEDPAKLALRIAVRAPLGQSIVRITATAGSSTEAAALANAIAAQVVDLGRPTQSGASIASIVQPGLEPREPSSPRIILNTAVGIVLGMGLALAMALLLARRREHMESSREATYGTALEPRPQGATGLTAR
jgi:capsular polysaccharide biosynthesis protein